MAIATKRTKLDGKGKKQTNASSNGRANTYEVVGEYFPKGSRVGIRLGTMVIGGKVTIRLNPIEMARDSDKVFLCKDNRGNIIGANIFPKAGGKFDQLMLEAYKAAEKRK